MRSRRWLALFCVAALAACGGSPGEEASGRQAGEAGADQVAPAGYETVVMTVPSMSCPLCSRSIEARLVEEGLRDVRIDLETKIVSAAFDPARTTEDEVKALVEGQGFPVTESRTVEK